MTRRHDSRAHATIALHKLPVQLRMLVRVMGEGPAFILAETRGGTRISVPTVLSDAQWLIDLVGVQAAAAMVAELPGQRLELPKYDSVTRQLRHQRVLALRLANQPLSSVALTTGYTVRQVINICNRNGLMQQAATLAGQKELFADLAEMDAADAAVEAEPPSAAHDPFGLAHGRR